MSVVGQPIYWLPLIAGAIFCVFLGAWFLFEDAKARRTYD